MNLRSLIPPSLRFSLRQLATRVRVRRELLAPWRWRARRWRLERYDLISFAPPENRLARELFRLEGDGEPCSVFDARDGRCALVSPMMLHASLRVPCDVHALVPLKRPLPEILERYDRELRRTLKKHRPRYRLVHATLPTHIEQLNHDMLEPYARARHGAHAVCPSLEEVRGIALGSGRLDVIEDEGTPVACHLGYALERHSERHWVTLRFGYAAAVFEDAKRLREVNSINTYLALEWAHQNGFDAYDMGSASARPDDGLLQWKRRREGALDFFHTEEWLSVRPPAEQTPTFFWDHPLFSIAGRELELSVGVPPGISDAQALERYRQLGFSGLAAVHVHSHGGLSAPLREGLQSLFSAPTAPARRVLVHDASGAFAATLSAAT